LIGLKKPSLTNYRKQENRSLQQGLQDSLSFLKDEKKAQTEKEEKL